MATDAKLVVIAQTLDGLETTIEDPTRMFSILHAILIAFGYSWPSQLLSFVSTPPCILANCSDDAKTKDCLLYNYQVSILREDPTIQTIRLNVTQTDARLPDPQEQLVMYYWSVDALCQWLLHTDNELDDVLAHRILALQTASPPVNVTGQVLPLRTTFRMNLFMNWALCTWPLSMENILSR
jgi:hypothetical protein